MIPTDIPALRRYDFWTSLVLMTVAAAMLIETLSYPLVGTYAGVQNAWYVSPALFPLLVAAMLIILAGLLMAQAVRAGAAAAALGDLASLRTTRAWRSTADFWIIAGILAGYVYALLPRIDFLAATSLFLLALFAVFHTGSARAARRLLALYVVVVAGVALSAWLGGSYGARTAAAYGRDVAVWAATGVGAIAMILAAAPAERGRARTAAWTSVLTPLILGFVFKYGLLVPLPTEGATVALMDGIRYSLAGLR